MAQSLKYWVGQKVSSVFFFFFNLFFGCVGSLLLCVGFL